MSLKVGQYIRNADTTNTAYLTYFTAHVPGSESEKTFQISTREDPNYPGVSTDATVTPFQNRCVTIRHGEEDGKFLESDSSYYFKAVLAKQTTHIYFDLVLRSSTDDSIAMIVDKNLYLPIVSDDTKPFEVFEFCFQPNTRYDQICFEIHRNGYDYDERHSSDAEGEQGTLIYGRLIDFYEDLTLEVEESIVLAKITNILDLLHSSRDSFQLVKLGVQAPTNFLFCINGEAIRMGKTGFYEINNSLISITFVGVANTKEKFILDYEYE